MDSNSDTLNRKNLFLFVDDHKTFQLSTDYAVPHVKKGSVSFDIKQYHVAFESIFKHVDMCKAFYAHLCEEHNSETLEFLVEFDKLEEVDSVEKAKAAIEIVKAIVEKYIKIGAPKELNLSSGNKNEVLAILKDQLTADTWTLEVQPRSVFLNTLRTLILELKTDVFPRFIRGVHCGIVVTANKTNTDIITLRKALEFPYHDSDFQQHIVTDRDFEFMKSLAEDSFDWELMGSMTSKLNSFFSSQSLLPNVTFLKKASIAKFECIFPFSFEKVMISCLPGYDVEVFDPNVMKMTELQYYSHEEYQKMMEKAGHEMETKNGKRALSVEIFDVKLPFPLITPRKYPICTSMDYDPVSKTFCMVHKPCIHPSYADKDGKVDWEKKRIFDDVVMVKGSKDKVKKPCHFMADLQSYHIQKLDDGRTSFKQIHVFDIKGWGTNQGLQKTTVKDRGIGLREMLVKVMSAKKENTIDEVKEQLVKDCLGRLLVDLDIAGLDQVALAKTKEDALVSSESRKNLVEKVEVSEKKEEIIEKQEVVAEIVVKSEKNDEQVVVVESEKKEEVIWKQEIVVEESGKNDVVENEKVEEESVKNEVVGEKQEIVVESVKNEEVNVETQQIVEESAKNEDVTVVLEQIEVSAQ